MTHKAGMALAGLMMLVLSACGGGKQNASNANHGGPDVSTQQMSCTRYQNMVNSGYDYRFESGHWTACSHNGDRYVLNEQEVRLGYMNDPCGNQDDYGWDQNHDDNGWNQRRHRRRVNNRDAKYQRWLKDHS